MWCKQAETEFLIMEVLAEKLASLSADILLSVVLKVW